MPTGRSAIHVDYILLTTSLTRFNLITIFPVAAFTIKGEVAKGIRQQVATLSPFGSTPDLRLQFQRNSCALHRAAGLGLFLVGLCFGFRIHLSVQQGGRGLRRHQTLPLDPSFRA